jgi:nucleoside 2-deoxyribosyltransferase
MQKIIIPDVQAAKRSALKVYLASPFFNDEQVKRLAKARDLIKDLGYEVWAAYYDGIVVSTDSSIEERYNSFKYNIDNISNSDLLVAITNDKDMGTLIEIGVAIQAKVPIIAFWENGSGPVNLMLAQASVSVAKTFDELHIALGDFKFFGKTNKINPYTGEIE